MVVAGWIGEGDGCISRAHFSRRHVFGEFVFREAGGKAQVLVLCSIFVFR